MCQDHNYNYKVYCKNFNGLGKNKFRTLDKVVSFADIMIRWVYNNSIFIVIIFFFSTLVNFNSFCNYQNLIRTIFGLIIYLFDFIVRLYHDILIWHHKNIKYYPKKILTCVKSLCFSFSFSAALLFQPPPLKKTKILLLSSGLLKGVYSYSFFYPISYYLL